MGFCSGSKAPLKAIIKEISGIVFKYAGYALTVTHKLKEWVNNPAVIAYCDLTPTDWDNQLRERVNIALEFALKLLQLIPENATVTNTVLTGVVSDLSNLSDGDREAKLRSLASAMAKHLDTMKRPDNIYDLAVQTVFSISKKV